MTGDRTIACEAEVRLLSFSGDGQILAGACRDNKVRLWDTASGRLERTVGLGLDAGRSVTLPPGGRWVAAAGADKVIKIWSLKNGELLHRLAGHTEVTGALAFSADGKMLASSSAREQSVRLWDVDSAQLRFILPDGIGGASQIAFSPGGEIVVGANWDTNLRVWDARTGKLLHTIEDLLVSMYALSFSPDGARLASAGVDRILYIWSTRNWRILRNLEGQPESITAMTFSPDGRVIATGGTDSDSSRNPAQVRLWDADSGAVLRTMPAGRGVTAVAFSPDNRLLAVADFRNTVNLWIVPPPAR